MSFFVETINLCSANSIMCSTCISAVYIYTRRYRCVGILSFNSRAHYISTVAMSSANSKDKDIIIGELCDNERQPTSTGLLNSGASHELSRCVVSILKFKNVLSELSIIMGSRALINQSVFILFV